MFSMIINKDNIFAHQGSGQKETLEAHSLLTLKYLKKLNEKKHIDQIVAGLVLKIFKSNVDQNKAYELFEKGIMYHDLGKINPSFQAEKMNNPLFEKKIESNHSLLSAILFIDLYNEELETENELSILLYAFAYAISKHHSSLNDLFQVDKLTKAHYNNFSIKCKDILRLPEYFKNWKRGIPDFYECTDDAFDLLVEFVLKDKDKEYVEDEIAFYMLIKLFYATLVSCDFYATYEYFNKSEVELSFIESPQTFGEHYYNGEIYKGIQSFQNNPDFFLKSPINELRSKMFLEAESNFLANKDKKIFYLEAPTGSGKTNTSINLAIHAVRECGAQSVFYAFPFNTLVEQTKHSLSNYFEVGEEMVPVNSLTEITTKNKTFEEALIDRQFFHYPLTLTSHINLFNGLFGTSREQNFLLLRLINSVVILDEVQCYKNSIWRQIALFMDKFGEHFNIKFIVMSATLPKLSYFITNPSIYQTLIKDTSIYYQNPLFRDRVKPDFSLMSKGSWTTDEMLIKAIQKEASPDKNLLIEFIKKKTARLFYEKLKSLLGGKPGLKVVELSGDDNNAYRKELINRIKNEKGLIIIATQVIEAGVDIDADVGFKDISIIDSEEQMIGRVNRSCLKPQSKVYFFKYDDASLIYRGDERLSFAVDNEKYREMFLNKQFDSYYLLVMEAIKQSTNGFNAFNIEHTYRSSKLLSFKTIQEMMTLIDQHTYQVVLNYEQEIDGVCIKGSDVWNEYKMILTDCSLKYAEKSVRLSQVKSKLALFTYNIDKRIKPDCFTDQIGDYLYYYEDGEKFIDKESKDDPFGKFNRQKFESMDLFS